MKDEDVDGGNEEESMGRHRWLLNEFMRVWILVEARLEPSSTPRV